MAFGSIARLIYRYTVSFLSKTYIIFNLFSNVVNSLMWCVFKLAVKLIDLKILGDFGVEQSIKLSLTGSYLVNLIGNILSHNIFDFLHHFIIFIMLIENSICMLILDFRSGESIIWILYTVSNLKFGTWTSC